MSEEWRNSNFSQQSRLGYFNVDVNRTANLLTAGPRVEPCLPCRSCWKLPKPHTCLITHASRFLPDPTTVLLQLKACGLLLIIAYNFIIYPERDEVPKGLRSFRACTGDDIRSELYTTVTFPDLR